MGASRGRRGEDAAKIQDKYSKNAAKTQHTCSKHTAKIQQHTAKIQQSVAKRNSLVRGGGEAPPPPQVIGVGGETPGCAGAAREDEGGPAPGWRPFGASEHSTPSRRRRPLAPAQGARRASGLAFFTCRYKTVKNTRKS